MKKNKQDLAVDSNTPQDILIELSKDREESIRSLVAQNSSTPISALIKLSKDKNWKVNFSAKHNQRWISYMTELGESQLKKELEQKIREAKELGTSVDRLKELSKDENKRVRYYVAQNPNTLVETLIALSKDHTWFVRNVTARHPKTPVEIINELTGYKKPLLEDREEKFRSLEQQFKRKTDLNKFLVFRADGKSFSKWTNQKLDKPFDKRFSELMKKVAYKIGIETEASNIFVVSDEISFVYEPNKHPFAGSHQKIISLLPAMISVEFTLGAHKEMGLNGSFIFDGRVLEVDSKTEADEVLNWRRDDGIRNSVQMLARSLYSHSDADTKSSKEMKQMIEGKGSSWYDIEDEFKWGTQWDRKEETRIFSSTEIEELPPLHNARLNPNLAFKRTVYQEKKRIEE